MTKPSKSDRLLSGKVETVPRAPKAPAPRRTTRLVNPPTALVVHRCPGCPETQEALPGATAWHYCPKREKRRTIFVPDQPEGTSL